MREPIHRYPPRGSHAGAPAHGAGGEGDQPSAGPRGVTPLRRLWQVLTRPRGDRLWDGIVRGTGVLGLAGIGLVLLVPAAGPLVGFVIFTLWITGPLSPLTPVGYETVLMLMGRIYDPLFIAVLGMAGCLYVEFLSYHLYGEVADLRALRKLRDSHWVSVLRSWFERWPFLTVWFCAWSPVPFWIVRFLGPMAGYPIGRYLTAFFLGRFPKIWFFAVLGLYWDLSDRLLVGLLIGSFLLMAAYRAFERMRSGPRPSRRPTTSLSGKERTS